MAQLSREEFQTWRASHDKQIDIIVNAVQAQAGINLNHEQRIAVVETSLKESAELVTRRTTWVSAVVSACVGGVVGWFGRP